MRPRKIAEGNAAGVIQVGRNVTIIPEEPQPVLSGRTTSKKIAVRYAGLDVVNGGPAENPDGLSPNDPLFPGWTIQEYNCATGVCASMPGTTTYVEIINNLPDDWEEAWLIVELEHVGASGTEYLFKVTSASIESADLPDDEKINLSYHYAGGSMAATSGAYSVQLATTVDGVRRMVSQFDAPDQHANYFDEDFLIQNRRDGAMVYSLMLDGVLLPEDRKLFIAAWDGTFRYLLETVP